MSLNSYKSKIGMMERTREVTIEEGPGAAEWACPVCTFTNTPTCLVCEMCEYSRPDDVPPATEETTKVLTIDVCT